MDDLTFKMLNAQGEETEYKVLFQFENAYTGKTYMTYTDDSNTRVYAGYITYEGDNEEPTLHPLESEEEWRLVEDYVDRVQSGVGVTVMVDESDLSPLMRRLLYGDDE